MLVCVCVFNSHTNTLINPHNYRGMSAAAAELMYIKLAQQLAEYGHEKLQEMVSNGCSIALTCTCSTCTCTRTYMYMYMTCVFMATLGVPLSD